MKTNYKLRKLRAQIDDLDEAIFRLCKKRMSTAEKLSVFKLKNGLTLLDRQREIEIKNNFYNKLSKQTQRKRAFNFVQALFELNPKYPKRNLINIPQSG